MKGVWILSQGTVYIYYLVLCLIFLHCPLSGPVLIYISLLIISCIIEYVTNKRTLNLDIWWMQTNSNDSADVLICDCWIYRDVSFIGLRWLYLPHGLLSPEDLLQFSRMCSVRVCVVGGYLWFSLHCSFDFVGSGESLNIIKPVWFGAKQYNVGGQLYIGLKTLLWLQK